MGDGDVSGADDGICVAVWTRVVELELHRGPRWICLQVDPTVPKNRPGMPGARFTSDATKLAPEASPGVSLRGTGWGCRLREPTQSVVPIGSVRNAA